MKTWNSISNLVAVIALTVLAGSASAQCLINGNIDAAPNTGDPSLGLWEYTFTVTWDNEAAYGLSHVNLFMDDEHANCSCAELSEALTLADPGGSSTGEGGCPLYYDSFIECSGDPSIGLDGIIIKFEPIEDGCEPGNVGTASFVFYSDYPPASIALPNLFMSDKFSTNSCHGTLTGVFPALPCDPVPDQATTWGGVKTHYR